MRFLPSVFLAVALLAPPAFADPGVATHEPVVEKVAPAIVAIQCKSPPRAGIGNGGDMGWFGTGTVVSEDGVILTSTTVVPPDVKADSILVSFAGGKQIKAEFVCGSADLELAMVRLPKGKYPHVEIGDSKKLKLGHVVYTFGNCQGAFGGGMIENDDEVAFAQGEVSGFYKIKDCFEGKAWYEWCTYKGDVIETTAPLNPGVDGGPLIDAEGRLIGLMSLSYNETRWLGVAVPQAVWQDRVTHWMKGDLVKDEPKEGVKPPKPGPDDQPGAEDENTGYLGIALAADEPVISGVTKNSPAAKVKLQKDDRIMSIDGKDMKTPAGIQKVLRSHKPGDELTIIVQRGSEKITVKVKLGYQPM